MSVTRIALIRERADELGISQLEWASFGHAKHSDAPAFYVELRRALAPEYEQRTVFKLPANELAAQQFLPGRRDRKHYLRLTDELIRAWSDRPGEEIRLRCRWPADGGAVHVQDTRRRHREQRRVSRGPSEAMSGRGG